MMLHGLYRNDLGRVFFNLDDTVINEMIELLPEPNEAVSSWYQCLARKYFLLTLATIMECYSSINWNCKRLTEVNNSLLVCIHISQNQIYHKYENRPISATSFVADRA